MAKLNGIDDALREGVETETISDERLQAYLDELRKKHSKSQEPESVSVSVPSPMSDEAFRGIAGEVVNSISPHTEADLHAILLQFLAMFGSVVGPSPHFSVEQTKHGTKLYVLIVGESSKGRKGTSFNQCLALFDGIDADWFKKCRVSGLSSSEGLIFRVRDEVIGLKEKDQGEQVETVTDPGVTDKRLLVVESEFTAVLRNFKREGNKLSNVIREAFDGSVLSILTKNSPLTATGSHISMVGHATKFELLKHMSEVEIANGFANRFLFCFAKRSKILPDGGSLLPETIELLRNRISRAVNFAKSVGQMKRDEEAQKYWHAVYPFLSEADPGMFGAIIGRREALVLRLCVIYALLDESDVIRAEHLSSALAVWKYCEESARYFFGEKLGDHDADDLLAALKDSATGLTRTEIRDFFQRNKKKSQVDRVISLLTDRGLAHWAEGSGPKVLKYGPAQQPSGAH
jgi:hypothetical protein